MGWKMIAQSSPSHRRMVLNLRRRSCVPFPTPSQRIELIPWPQSIEPGTTGGINGQKKAPLPHNPNPVLPFHQPARVASEGAIRSAHVRGVISRHAPGRRVTPVSAAVAHNMFTSWRLDSGALKSHYKPVEKGAQSKLLPPAGSDSGGGNTSHSCAVWLIIASIFFFFLFLFSPSTFTGTQHAMSAVFRFREHMWHFNMSRQSRQDVAARPGMNYEALVAENTTTSSRPTETSTSHHRTLFPAS